MKGVEYRGVTSVDGPIVVLKRTENVFYNETVCVRDRLGEKRTGKVVDISDEAVEEIFEVALQARGGNQLYYDPQFGRLFKSDDDTLIRATDELIGDLKRRKDPEQYISYNKWFMQIDLPGIVAGEDYAVAWYDQAYTQFAYTSELEITGLELNLGNTVKIGKRAVTVIHWRNSPVWVEELKPKRH